MDKINLHNLSNKRSITTNPHFWAIVALLAICLVLQYPQQLLHTSSLSLFSFMGLTRHAAERILLLIPISYTGYFLGLRAGLAGLGTAIIIMLPRVFLMSEYFADALFETIVIGITGTLIILGFERHKRNVTKEKEMQNRLMRAYQELSEANRLLKTSQEQLIRAEKLTSLGQLTASFAHEINNPLTGVLMYTKLLYKKISSGDIKTDLALNYLTKMDVELMRTTGLIQNLRDFAKQSPPTLRQVSMNDVVSRTLDLVNHLIGQQHIKVIKELNPSAPMIMADFNQLCQVFANLILNAIQAMPDGGQLTLRNSVDGNRLKIEIQDTGKGISEDNMPRLFTPFFTTKPEVKGVGLGLAVAYGIIERHGGTIEVQSQPGKGSTFTVYLPLQNN
jgi:signal transduction histidine kinase